MKIINNYRQNAALRRSFNRLAEATFGLNFENWYQNGFWGDAYDPYSVVIDGEVVANVSLNRTDMIIKGKLCRLYQLGTVMTAPEHRNKGYIRAIMAEIERDTADADGIYLFANDEVLDFYPKFGFTVGTEYIFTKAVSQNTAATAKSVPMNGREAWDRLACAMENAVPLSSCHAVGNPGLVFFYVTQFMRENVYYLEEANAWVIAEVEAGNLFLHDIFSPEAVSLDMVISAFGPSITSVALGFTPNELEGWECREHQEDDCTFFVKGRIWDDFTYGRFRIPTLSHA